MKKLEMTLPELGLIAGTRGMIGAGIGLLMADKFNDDKRKAIGWTLFAVGALSTIPLALEVLGKSHEALHEAPEDRRENMPIAA